MLFKKKKERKGKENENRIKGEEKIWNQTGACDEVFYSKNYAKNIDSGKPESTFNLKQLYITDQFFLLGTWAGRRRWKNQDM